MAQEASGKPTPCWKMLRKSAKLQAPSQREREEEPPEGRTTNLVETCREVTERADEMLREDMKLPETSLLSIALDHLTLARAALYEAVLTGSSISNLQSPIFNALDGLRKSGNMDDLPRGLLTRAWYRHLTGDAAGAAADLDEAWEIAERGPMPLYQAEIHLTRARLFGARNAERGTRNEETPYPWASATEDLSEARRLIEKHGYLRRTEELQDAEAALRAAGATPENTEPE